MMDVMQSNSAEAEADAKLAAIHSMQLPNGPEMIYEKCRLQDGNLAIVNKSSYLPESARFGFVWFDDWMVCSNPDWLTNVAQITAENEGVLETVLHKNIECLTRTFLHSNQPFFIFKTEPFFLEPYLNEYLLKEAKVNAYVDGKHSGLDMKERKNRDKVMKSLLDDLKTMSFDELLKAKSKTQSKSLAKLFIAKSLAEYFGRITLIASGDLNGIKISAASFPNPKERKKNDLSGTKN